MAKFPRSHGHAAHTRPEQHTSTSQPARHRPTRGTAPPEERERGRDGQTPSCRRKGSSGGVSGAAAGGRVTALAHGACSRTRWSMPMIWRGAGRRLSPPLSGAGRAAACFRARALPDVRLRRPAFHARLTPKSARDARQAHISYPSHSVPSASAPSSPHRALRRPEALDRACPAERGKAPRFLRGTAPRPPERPHPPAPRAQIPHTHHASFG